MNFQESTTILNACTKKYGNLLKAPRMKEIESMVATHIVQSFTHS